MFARFDASKSTKGASKLRRDLINAEIANLRDLLPLPPSTRQRLSQLQLMALVCVYVRKANYFQQAFKRHDISVTQAPTPNIGFSKALSGFLMMMTQNGKLLYISDNAAEYLGHSMEDLLIHGDSVYDIIDKQDHEIIQLELGRIAAHESLIGADETSATLINDCRMFLCRMNVSRNSRRQLRFGDQKVVLVRGHYLSFLPLCSRNEPVFLATCTPIAMPETRECVVLGATNVFTSIHSMDMKFMHIDKNGEFHLEYTKNEIQGISWYKLLHWEYIREAQTKHKLITQNEQDRSCILLVKLQTRTGEWLWVHCVLQVKENMENNQQPVIVCTNQVLSDHEAGVMHTNGWLYHNYMVHNKLQYGLSGYDAHTSSRVIAYYHHNNPTTTVVSPSSSVVPILHCTNSSEIPPTTYTSRSERNQNQYNTNLQHHHQYQSTYVHNTIYPPSLPQYGAPNEHHDGHINSKAVFSHQQKNLNSPRTEVEPVDYSVHNNTTSIINNNHIINDRTASNYQQTEAEFQSRSPSTTSYNNNNYYKRNNKLLSNNVTVTNPAAITTILDFEPLKINQSEQVIMDMDQFSQADGILLMPPASYRTNRLQKTFFNTTNRARLMLRADPADFIEQWNPSPPWTDTSQPKVTDVTTPHQHHHQDTSPPVTPTVSYSPQTARAAFTFDLIQEDHDEYLVQKHTSVLPNRSTQTTDDEHINNRISLHNESLNYSYTTTTSATRSVTTISPLVSNHSSGNTMYIRPPTPLPYVSERQVTHSEPSLSKSV